MSLDRPHLLAALSFAALAGVVLLLALRAYRRTAYTPGQAAIMALNYVYTRLIWRTTVEGRFPFLSGRGAVVVSNHRCPLDPAFLALILRRMVHWMVAREYAENPAIRWFFRTCQCISVGRGGVDTAATKAAIRLAAAGGLVGIFPEGRINLSDRLLAPGRPGAVLVALKARVPIVPCYIEGSPYDGTVWGCLFMAAKVRLVIGQPIMLDEFFGREGDRAVLEEVTRRVLREIAALAGQPDYPVELAGRFYKPAV